MSKEGSPELIKSWVFVDPDKESSEDDKEAKETSGLQEVAENEPHGDSESDSISVISESGCSYKTDEEEFSSVPAVGSENENDNNPETEEKESEIVEKQEIIKDESEVIEPKVPESIEENKGIEKLLYFATSAVCAIVLIGLSVAVQQYLQGASDVNTLDPDQDFIYPLVQNVKTDNVISESPKKYNYKRKHQYNVEELENKIAKLQEIKINDKIISSVEDNDPKRDSDVKSNYKLSKNKSFKCNKENCDAKTYKNEKIRRDENNEKATEPVVADETIRSNDETYDKKIKQLRVKEDYLREKEKFLIEKEHDLMKKEIKLNKEKQHYEKNKHDKSSSFKKGKEDKKSCFKKGESCEGESEERKDKFKPNKEYLKENFNTKNNKKYKYKEEKKEKEHSAHRRYKFSDENDKKRNISGQWYMNLHEARNHMRQKKRASFKKNKAHWYFQWMVDRARLRVK